MLEREQVDKPQPSALTPLLSINSRPISLSQRETDLFVVHEKKTNLSRWRPYLFSPSITSLTSLYVAAHRRPINLAGGMLTVLAPLTDPGCAHRGTSHGNMSLRLNPAEAACWHTIRVS